MQPKIEPTIPTSLPTPPQTTTTTTRYMDICDQYQHQHKMTMLPLRYDQNSFPPGVMAGPSGAMNDGGGGGRFVCSQCGELIRDRYLLYTNDRLQNGRYWHVGCLRCQCCHVQLADLGNSFYTKENHIFCKQDYIKIYGSKPCSTCSQLIQAHERVMRVNQNFYYHLDCFCCQKCRKRLQTGDRYVFLQGHLFCEKDNPLKSAPNEKSSTPTSTTKRGGGTKRGAKSSRANQHNNQQSQREQYQQQQPPPSQLPPPSHHHMQQQQHVGYSPSNITLMNNHHHSHQAIAPATHSILNNSENNY